MPLAHPFARLLGVEPAYTTWKLRPNHEAKMTIDYVLCSAALVPRQVLGIPEEAAIDECRLPSHAYPSDHFAIAASFDFV